MPGKITFDEAVTSAAPSQGITFDEAMNERLGAARPLRQDDRPLYQVPPAERGGGDLVARDGRVVSVPAIQQAPAANFGASLKAGLVEDPGTKQRLVSESLGVDPSRVGLVGGRPVFVDDQGQLRYVSSGAARLGAGIAANAPEAAGAVIGSFATGNPVLGGAAGAVGGKAVKQIIAGTVLGEPQTTLGNLRGMATEGALNLATGGAGKGIAKVADRGKLVDFTPANVRTAEQARDYIKQSTGIDVDLAQASGNRKLIAIRAYSARFPGRSAELVQAADEAAEGQLDTAVERVLNLVATATPAETASAQGVNAAKMAIEAARRKASNDVRPLYDAAYAAVPEVTDARIVGFLKLPYFKEAFAKGQKIATLEGAAAKTTPNVPPMVRQKGPGGVYRYVPGPTGHHGPGSTTTPDLRSLDYTKRALDDQIESLIDAGKRQEARALKLKRDEFVAAVDAIPNQQWQLARRRYAELMEQTVKPLEDGAVGVLANIKNPHLASAAAKIFADKNITPAEIARTRFAISQQDPEAWNGLVRQWIGQNWNKALRETQTGDVVNPAGKLRQALIGTPADRARMRSMLPGPAARAFEDLMTAAESLARTPIAGSNTMRDTEIKDQLKGTGAVVFRWLTSPRQSVVQAAEQRALEQNTVAITEAILDPAKQRQLRQVVRMPPSTRKAIILTAILGGQVTKVAAKGGPTELPAEQKQRAY